MRPGVDDLIVALTIRDVAGGVGLLETRDALLGLGEQRLLFLRDVEVFDSNRDTAARSVAESELLESIEERNRALQPALAV